jgi:diketogulonate reductase-like aldo/keto reductase
MQGTHTLRIGTATVPQLGFGTWELRGDTCARMVSAALGIGYRHIDTARMYGNETAVGEGLSDGLRRHGLDRGDIWITTKIWPDQFADGDLQAATARSLTELGVGQVDLLLLHWPNPSIPLGETMAALADTLRQGMVRHIGLSNFPTALMRQAIGACPEPLTMIQVEYHPFLDQTAVLDAAAANGLGITAYCPLAKGRVFEDETVGRIARAHGRSPSQIALRWLLQQGVVAIPRSSKEAHARDNFAVWDFALDEAEMAALSALRRRDGRLIDPAGLAPDWD